MEISSDLSSWGQAFEDHPIAQMRVIEKQLRADIAHNKQKLRNLVGGSYRDLLATAEHIVTLDSKTNNVEGKLSELGRNCKPKPQILLPPRSTQHSIVAQLILLHRCSNCIATCLKAGHVILAAKLLAMSRLLHTSLSKQDHPPKILDTLLEQLSRSRRRLLRRVDRRLEDAGIEQAELTEVVSAFCLATSSSCSDAIHHYQRRRLGQIHRSAQGGHGDHQHTVRTFKYYINSLRTTQLLLGQDVPRALQKLQQVAILQDPEVLHLEHLDLDTLRMLMPNEIQTFTPYVRKSVLSEHDASSLLARWSEEAFTGVNEQLTTHLETLTDTSTVFQLRQELLSAWLESCFSTPAHVDIVDMLRSILNGHIESLIQAQISEISNIATHMIESSENGPEIVKTSNTNATIPAIWGPSLVTSSLTTTASSFLDRLQSVHLGGSPSLLSIATSLTTWCHLITTLRTQINTLTEVRWQDALEESDHQDEDAAELILRTLGTDDPASYLETLTSSLDGALTSFQDRLAAAANSSNITAESLFLLRAIRETKLQLSAAFPEIPLEQLHSAIPHLHAVLAVDIVTKLAARMEKFRKRIPVAVLPPNLPSPPTFSTLRSLCAIMLEIGEIDTWIPAAVKAVKEAVLLQVVNGETKAHYLRNAFDEVYLRTALGGSTTEMEEVDGEVRKAAVEYWSRTRLLFGVLDP